MQLSGVAPSRFMMCACVWDILKLGGGREKRKETEVEEERL